MSSNPIEVPSLNNPGFDYLRPEGLTMNRVPVIGDAVQVGIPEEIRDSLPKAQLGITIERASMTVSRADQMAQLAIEVTGDGVQRAPVLDESVPALRFAKMSSGLWTVDALGAKMPSVINEAGLGRFMNVLITVSLGLQNPRPKTT